MRGFPGLLLLVSHDRALLDAVGTRMLAVEDGELRSYQGSWAEYVEGGAARGRAASRVDPACQTEGCARANAGGERDKVGRSNNALRVHAALKREIAAAEAV